MFQRIAKWWRDGEEYRRNHDAEFAPFKAIDADGISVFQRRIMSEIQDLIAPHAFARETADDGVLYLVADIPGTRRRLYVYPAEAGIVKDTSRKPGYSNWEAYEEWDFRAPEQLVAAVTRAVRNNAG